MTITASRPDVEQSRRARLLADRVLELLEDERDALERGDIDALPAIGKSKERAVLDLHAACMAHPGKAGNNRSSLDSIIARIASLNSANGQHVAVRLAYARARIGGLSNAARIARASVDASSMYSASGFAGDPRPSGALFGTA